MKEKGRHDLSPLEDNTFMHKVAILTDANFKGNKSFFK